jgi:hypothetical protein
MPAAPEDRSRKLTPTVNEVQYHRNSYGLLLKRPASAPGFMLRELR